MRDLLTGLAIVVIIALTAALVGPYFVDWNGQRGFLEARLTRALGQKVTIGGHVDLKLLPTPYLVLDQTVIGDDGAPLRVGIRHLNIELAPTPLLHGEFEFTQARLDAPTLRITLGADRALPTMPQAPAFGASLRFDRIQVGDGTIVVADPQSGRNLVIDHLDFTADAPSLAGPFKGDGQAGVNEQRTGFRFSTTAAQGGRVRMRFAAGATATHPSVDLDGTLSFARRGEESLTPAFDGTVALSRDGTASEGPLAWRLSGPLKLSPTSATLEGGELRLGDQDVGISLATDGHIAFGDEAGLDLAVSAKQLDIDRLSGAPVNGASAPPRAPSLSVVRRLVDEATPIRPATLDMRVETATWGGKTFSNIGVKLGLDAGGVGTLQVEGQGPGASDVGFDGRFVTKDSRIEGTFRVSADDAQAAVAWLDTIAPDVSLRSEDVPFHAVKTRGRLQSSPDGVAFSDLTLSVERSVLTGNASFAYARPSRPAALALDLRGDALDLDTLPTLGSISSPLAPFDLDVKLDARAIKVAAFGSGTLAAGHMRLALVKTGRDVVVKTFEADDIGGAKIAVSGRFGPDKATFNADIDARKLNDTADLAKRLFPGWATDGFAERASVLAPTKLKLEAELSTSRRDANTFDVMRVDVAGKLAATSIDAHLVPDGDREGAVKLKATADAPEGGALLAQLGFRSLPLDLLGTSRLAMTADGIVGRPFDTHIDAQFGATKLASSGRYDLGPSAKGGSGTIVVKSSDVGPILQALAIAFPDVIGHIPVDISGGVAVATEGVALTNLKGTLDGLAAAGTVKWQHAMGDAPALTGAVDIDRLSLASLLGLSFGPAQPAAPATAFSTQPFGTGLVDPPRTLIRVKAKALDLGIGRNAEEAMFELGVGPNHVDFKGLSASLGGGQLVGHATLRRDGGQAAVEGRLGLDNVAFDLPSVKGRVSGHLDLAGSGSSALALAGSLAGSGEASIAGMTIPGADPAALPPVFDAVETDAIAVDRDSVVRALESAIREPLEAGDRRFRLGLASGDLRFDPVDPPATTGPVASDVALTLDTKTPNLAVTAIETLKSLPKNWTGAPPAISIIWSGPVATPVREIDVGSFLDAVAARALARETARIEAYEFDIRERAFFNARLQADRRREADRLKAEDDARKAEAARAAARRAADEKAAAERRAAEQPPVPSAGANPPPPTNAPVQLPGAQGPTPGAQR